MDDIDRLDRIYTNMKQIDSFFNGPEYQILIDMAKESTPTNRRVAEHIVAQVDLIDASIDFFTEKRIWPRCYGESVKLVTILRECVDKKYNPV
jgi:hypothetical protein